MLTLQRHRGCLRIPNLATLVSVYRVLEGCLRLRFYVLVLSRLPRIHYVIQVSHEGVLVPEVNIIDISRVAGHKNLKTRWVTCIRLTKDCMKQSISGLR